MVGRAGPPCCRAICMRPDIQNINSPGCRICDPTRVCQPGYIDVRTLPTYWSQYSLSSTSVDVPAPVAPPPEPVPLPAPVGPLFDKGILDLYEFLYPGCEANMDIAVSFTKNGFMKSLPLGAACPPGYVTRPYAFGAPLDNFNICFRTSDLTDQELAEGRAFTARLMVCANTPARTKVYRPAPTCNYCSCPPQVDPDCPPPVTACASTCPQPVPSPVLAPFSAPVPSPVLTPFSAPVPSPVLAPFSAPAQSPDLAPFSAPVPSPVLAPVPSPVLAPVPVTVPSSSESSFKFIGIDWYWWVLLLLIILGGAGFAFL
jgi:hypothetical protein